MADHSGERPPASSHAATTSTAEWVLHVDEPTRALVAGAIDDTAAALRSGAEWTSDDRGAHEVTLPRAVRLDGGRRAVRLVVRSGMLGLHAPARGASMRRRLAVFGPIGPEAVGTAIDLQAESALRSWSSGLAASLDAGRRAEAKRFRTAAAMLGLGAVDSLGAAWDWFTVSVGSRGRHSITMRPTAARRGEFISFEASSLTGPRMTAELVEAFDGLIRDHVHVSEGAVRSPQDMPTIAIGDLPRIRLASDANAVDRLAAIASLPAGARLIMK